LQDLEQELLDIFERSNIDLLCSLPCDRVKRLICMADGGDFVHMHMTREEDGVGICAGAALAGKRAAMIVQSSGIGNMVNALVSLTGFYELPLAIFVSQRGVYKEGIDAQVPMGLALPGLLDSIGISYTYITKEDDLLSVQDKLNEIYSANKIHVFLMSPEIWESSVQGDAEKAETFCPSPISPPVKKDLIDTPSAIMNRYGVIDALKEALRGHVVIGNIGVPSKELFEILDQPTNFYMLGSMGLATPIGLGVALFTKRKVFVIDGDGSLLMNPGTLATVAASKVNNLVILALDNAAYGSTGCQPTLTGSCVDLEVVARGFGISSTSKVATGASIHEAASAEGAQFVHIQALSGNQPGVANIPLDKMEIKNRFMDALL
jgi:sulfopyruvate decarboxylase beta subunit